MQEAEKRRVPSIRTRLRRIVMTPTAALVAVWLVVSGVLFYDAAMELALSKANERYLTPSAVALTTVMKERTITVGYLEHPDELEDELDEAQKASSDKMGTIITDYDELKPLVPESSVERITRLQESYEGIEELRASVKAGTASRREVLDFFNGVTSAAADVFDDLSRAGTNPESMGPGVSATSTFRAVDQLGRADAQLIRSFAEDELSHPDMHAFVQEFGAYRSRMEQTAPFLGPEQRVRYRELTETPEFQRLNEYVDQIMQRPAETETDPVSGEVTERFPMPVDKEDWDEAYLAVFDELTAIGADEALYAGSLQANVAYRSMAMAVLGSAGVGALAILAVLAATRSAHRLVDRLHRLRDDTEELTERRLPGIMDRLRRHEPVELDDELPDLVANQEEDEIGRVARSFDTAQRTAVEAAINQAELRHGVNRVFLSIAHRSQTLIHRQLRLLDRMERDQEDPAQLTELFKLDHLATRSRRNAENLLILGGENPGRTWHRPMPLVDVLRGAISESGDYSRVQRNHIARVSLIGPAVADVIHLVAELVDNATAFSPPHTRVMLSSEQVPNGVTVEIEDRGLGMQDEEFESANALLADPPEFDVMRLNEKMRLGLFVVSRLAKRHGIKVWLRSSPYGGVQAIVLLPPELISEAPLPSPPRELPAPVPAPSDGDLLGASDGPSPAAEERELGGEDAAVEDTPDTPDGAPEPDGAPLEVRAEDRADKAVSALAAFAASDGHGANGSARDGGPATTPAGLPRRGSRRSDSAESRDTRPAPAPAPTGGDGGGADRPALPKRRPQTNLAPQLADRCPNDPAADADGGADGGPRPGSAPQDPERSERLRRNMSAFQQGTRRGREESRGQGRTAADDDTTEDTEKDS
ncbi:nitrate- and nitrite sensing domain-containing protein [Nocardiopsis sp. RSe5-2]|uniref:histidine kinase n=1 Tax=Nocardiopsis endophytica TaxID=3018445 RepID=A0ABT4U1R3_9ACTN|nr:nitrate- and nitrite sensing domain-containing protein [Nocardiopsis endophytica]MDA2810880.1 nitrate- and nitrite sensing domain-containing protein [Nocardiopsis endophytica]